MADLPPSSSPADAAAATAPPAGGAMAAAPAPPAAPAPGPGPEPDLARPRAALARLERALGREATTDRVVRAGRACDVAAAALAPAAAAGGATVAELAVSLRAAADRGLERVAARARDPATGARSLAEARGAVLATLPPLERAAESERDPARLFARLDEARWLGAALRAAATGDAGRTVADALAELRSAERGIAGLALAPGRDRARRRPSLRGGPAAPALSSPAAPAAGESAAVEAELAAARESLRAGRADATRARVERYLDGAAFLARPGSGASLDDVGRALVAATDCAADLAGAPLSQGDASDLLRQLADARTALRRRLSDGLSALGPDARAARLAALAQAVTDGAEDALAAADELEENRPALAEATLQAALEDVRWFEEVLARAAPTPAAAAAAAAPPTLSGRLGRLVRRRRSPVSGAVRDVRRARRSIEDHQDDQRVEMGLERRLGRRTVALLEATIFGLLVVALVLVGVELLGDPSPSELGALHAADGAICAVLLSEFFVKLAHSGRRGRFLSRYAATMLIPSIPFGLLASQLAAADAARFARLARLPQVARGFLAARVLRLLFFLQRGVDGLVRRLRPILDREVVIFASPLETAAAEAERPDDLAARVARVVERLRRAARAEVEGLPRAARARLLAARARSVAAEMRAAAAAAGLRLRGAPPRDGDGAAARAVALAEDTTPAIAGRGGRPVLLERVIEGLERADAASVEAFLGRGLASRIARVLKLFDAPLLRRLPGVRAALAAERDDPLGIVAAWAHGLGSALEGVLERIRAWGDLQGVVSAPPVLDRVGETFYQWTERPAKRVVSAIALFIGLRLAVGLLGVNDLNQMLRDVQASLGPAVIAVGAICFVLAGFGWWLRRIAGEATQVYSRVAEAQFAGLVERRPGAEAFAAEELFETRVLEPEIAVRGEPARVDRDRAALLYRDFLDGAPLHAADTRVSEHLLGNLTLAAVIEERLRLPAKERARLARLDLARARALGGPYFWFHLISQSVTEQTAKLLMEYNRYCIPRSEPGREGPDAAQARAAAAAWLAGRLGRGPAAAAEHGARERRQRDRARRDVEHYGSTEFHILHFLDPTPERDASVAAVFGEDVLAALRADRRRLGRKVFGSFPLHRLPDPLRRVNVYEVYQSHFAGGQVVLLPLRVVALLLRGLLEGARALGRLVGEILRPTFSAEDIPDEEADGAAALRKVHRMRKPIFLAVAELRARFDPEYLGCPVRAEATAPGEEDEEEEEDAADEEPRPGSRPGSSADASAGAGASARASSSGGAGRPPPYLQDLELIGGLDTEREPFEALRRERERALVRFRKVVASGALGEGVGTEGVRAAWIAYAADYRGARTLEEAEDALDRRLWPAPGARPGGEPGTGTGSGSEAGTGTGTGTDGDAEEDGIDGVDAAARSIAGDLAPAEPALARLKRRIGAALRRAARTRIFTRDDPLEVAFYAALAARGGTRRPPAERLSLFRAFLADEGGLASLLADVEAHGPHPREAALAILRAAARDPGPWTRQLVAVRAVQTIAVLDVLSYHSVVLRLGDFPKR